VRHRRVYVRRRVAKKIQRCVSEVTVLHYQVNR